ncbi:MAG: hypothetical protein DCC75_04225 [Proteobacteria bacterium]|nr:MAG: hypothetical protein DCC75_04225 [Pseudomonadota bacterium]
MLSRFYRLIAAILVVGLALYMVTLNREAVSIALSPNYKISANAGVIFICVFVAGVLCTALVALYLGFKSYWREKGLHHRERQRLSFLQSMILARSALASGEWLRAKALWEGLLKLDPTDIIARVELSRSYELAGELLEALKVLEAARAKEPGNLEVLFQAAELNIKLGNKTAAIDNLALILYHQPVKKAALLARSLSEDLGRIDDALEYQARYESLATGSETEQSQRSATRLRFKKVLQEFSLDDQKLLDNVRDFCRRNAECLESWEKLAALERERGDYEAAGTAYVRAAKLSQEMRHWHEAFGLWLERRQPDRALAAAKVAVKDTKGVNRIYAELELIRLLIKLNMLDQAKTALQGFGELAKQCEVSLTREVGSSLTALKGLHLLASGQVKEAAELWRTIAYDESSDLHQEFRAVISVNGEAPSPTLSTP